MAEGLRLRRVVDPVVAAPPAGVRVRTRLRVSEAEAAALTTIGSFLGSVYRGELGGRIRCGALDSKAQAAWRAERKQAVTAVSPSRWAGAITRTVEDQYRLGMRGLAAHVAELRAAIAVLEQRCALRPVAAGVSEPRRAVRQDRRLAALRGRLANAEKASAAGHPSMVVGGGRLWRARSNIDMTDMTEQQWRDRWDACRMFLTADGESGKAGGNETIRVDDDGHLRIKVPAALTEQLGSHLVIRQPVRFAHQGAEWLARVSERRAVRYDISYDAAQDRWYLDASWKATFESPPDLGQLRTGQVLDVDLNADHLACGVLDAAGNPIGYPRTIPVETEGLPAGKRDGRVRAAITSLIDQAAHAGCTAIVVENLDFADARATGRETLGRGQRGKRLRRSVACMPTRKFRNRLTSMASHRGIAVIGVDAAYTSKWGNQHWTKPLQQQTSDPVTRHHAAAVAIGRRGLGLAIRRRPAGPRSGQRTTAGTPPTRPHRHPSHGGRRGSSDPPARPLRGVPVHRKTPARRGQHRSGRTGLAPDH